MTVVYLLWVYDDEDEYGDPVLWDVFASWSAAEKASSQVKKEHPKYSSHIQEHEVQT